MSEAVTNSSESQRPFLGVEWRLTSAWLRELSFVTTRGLLCLLVAAALLLVADYVIDRTFKLSGDHRLLLLGGNAFVVLFALWWTWWRHFKRYDPVRVALEVEGLYPRLKSLLVSYVQLHDEAKQTGGISPALVRAMCRQTVEETRSLRFGRIVRFRTLRSTVMLCFAALLLAVAVGLRQPELFNVFLTRMTNPFSSLSYPIYTRIEQVTPARLNIQEGQPVTLEVRAGGEIPAEGTLTIRRDEGDAETVRIAAGKETRPGMCAFTYPIKEAYYSFSYSFQLGDASSDECRVNVIPPPRIEPRLTVTYPAYTKRQPQETEALGPEILEGSKITWTLKSDRPLAVAEMFTEGTPLPVTMDLSSDGKTITHSSSPAKSFTYSFRWTDKDYQFVYAPGVRYSVQVVPDRSPRVDLISPTRDEKATVEKELEIVFTAKDDYGLSSVRLVYVVESKDSPGTSGPEQFVPIRTFAGAALEARETFQWPVQKTIADLKPGYVIRYAVEVFDNREGQAGATRSEPPRRLSVVSPEEYLRLVMEERNRLLSRIKELHAKEKLAAEAVGELDGSKP